MSTKTSGQKKTASASTSRIDHEHLRQSRKAIAELDRVRKYVPHVLAFSALVEREDDAHDVSEELATEIAEVTEIQEIFNKFDTAFRAADGTPERIDDMSLFDVFYTYASKRARASYLLGIAVGQQLVPDAFKGGAR